jgi:hypothetical protein
MDLKSRVWFDALRGITMERLERHVQDIQPRSCLIAAAAIVVLTDKERAAFDVLGRSAKMELIAATASGGK